MQLHGMAMLNFVMKNVKMELHKYVPSVSVLNGLICVPYQSVLDIFVPQVFYVHVK